MRIHTDLIYANHIYLASRGIEQHDGQVWVDKCDEHGSRSRVRAYEVSLLADSAPGRRRKRNMQHVKQDPDGMVAATYDEWGIFIRNLFERDSTAIIGIYKGRADFHAQTRYRFEPHPWTLEHSARCLGCLPVDESIKERVAFPLGRPGTGLGLHAHA